jgi:hypothetical protein
LVEQASAAAEALAEQASSLTRSIARYKVTNRDSAVANPIARLTTKRVVIPGRTPARRIGL